MRVYRTSQHHKEDLIDGLLYDRDRETNGITAHIANPAILIERHALRLRGTSAPYTDEYIPLKDMPLDLFAAILLFPDLVESRSPEQQLNDLYSAWDEAWDEDAIYSDQTLFNAHKSAVKTAAEILGYVYSAGGFKPKGDNSL